MGEGSGTPLDQLLEKHWSVLSPPDRAALLKDLGIDGKNEEFLAGKTMDQILQGGQYDLPNEVWGRLIMAVTDGGFTKEEYERVRELHRKSKESKLGTPERGN